MFLCISPKLHALCRSEGKEQHRLALSYNIGIVMVDQAPKLRCMPSITEGLSDCFRRQTQPTEKEPPERNPGRTRRAGIIDRAKRATVHLPSGLRSGRRAVSPNSVRQPRPVSFPCPLLPPLSFGEASLGEALLDVDELFSSISGSSNPTSLPSDQTDRSPTPLHSDQTDQSPVVQDKSLTSLPSDQTDQIAETQGQQTQPDEDREESASQHPLEPASTESSSSGSLTHMVQPPSNRAQNHALLQSCIEELLAAPQRRPARERQMRRFDDGTRPAPLITAGLTNGGYSLFPSTRQRAGTAATPPTLRSQPEQPERPERPELSKGKARLDSAAIPASETPQVSTLDPLGEECRDSGADVDDQYAPVVGPSTDPSNANAPPLDRPESQIEIAVKEPGPQLLDPPTIALPPLPQPSSVDSQPASQTLPLASFNSAPSLRTSKPSRCRPANFVQPQRSQASGLVAAASSSALRGDVETVVDGPSSSTSRVPAARSSLSPPPVSPCDRTRD